MADGIVSAVAYYRMSSNDQDGSIEQQKAWAADACPREGIEVLQEFIDEGKKGHETAKRTAFHQMLEFCRDRWERRQPVEAIVCWHTNRFSRSDGIETSWFVHEFRKAGVNRMYTASGRWIDFRRMEDRILFGITQDASNHPYVQQLSMDSLRGRLATAEAGDWCGGPPPFGYRVEVYDHVRGKGGKKKPRKRLVPDPATAEIVRWLFRAYAADGASLYQLARKLNDDGVKPHRGAERWTPTVVREILRNEVYLGDLIWNKKSNGKFFGVVDCQFAPRDGSSHKGKNDPKHRVRRPSRHEALVDRELFDRVQVLMVERRCNKTPIRGGGNLVLTSLLRCGHCGRPMIGRNQPGSRKGPPGVKVPRYVCGTYATVGKQACHYNCIDEAPLVRAIAAKLRANLLNPETLARLRQACRQEVERTGGADPGTVARLTAQLADLEKQVVAAARKFLLVEDERASRECKKALDGLAAEKDRVERALAEARDRTLDQGEQEERVDKAVALMYRFEEVLRDGAPAAVRATLRSIIDHVDLYFDYRSTTRRTYCTFVRGVIYVKGDTLPCTYLLGVS
jgi:DNA invertase Pin-like site-specific DNA recombinase